MNKEERLAFKERNGKASNKLKEKGLIRNPILGWVTVAEVNRCIKEGIVTFRQGHYCIPMEAKLIAVHDGKLSRGPVKTWVVSHKYIEYMQKTGRMI